MECSFLNTKVIRIDLAIGNSYRHALYHFGKPRASLEYAQSSIFDFRPSNHEFSMFQTLDFRCVQTLATAAPGYRDGVYVINVTYSRKLRSVAPAFSIMLYIVNYISSDFLFSSLNSSFRCFKLSTFAVLS